MEFLSSAPVFMNLLVMVKFSSSLFWGRSQFGTRNMYIFSIFCKIYVFTKMKNDSRDICTLYILKEGEQFLYYFYVCSMLLHFFSFDFHFFLCLLRPFSEYRKKTSSQHCSIYCTFRQSDRTVLSLIHKYNAQKCKNVR